MLFGIATVRAADDGVAKDPVTASCEKEAADSGLTDKEDIKAYVAECTAAVKAEQASGNAVDKQ